MNYEIDFANMTQKNLGTNKIRKITREDPNAISPSGSGHSTGIGSISSSCIETSLPPTSPDYIRIQNMFDKSMKGKYKASTFTVTEINNSAAKWKFQALQQIKLFESKVNPAISELFYGNSKISPSDIYNIRQSTFPLSLADKEGYGKGIYFSTEAEFSCTGTHEYKASTGEIQLILATVIVGNSADLTSNPDNNLIDAPNLPGNSVLRYDSVKGKLNNSEIYVIYKADQAYAKYMITFKP